MASRNGLPCHTAASRARGWLHLITLLLILAFLPIPSARAAPPEKPQQKRAYQFSLTASVNGGREGAPICSGETVTFTVNAWRSAVDSIDSHRDIARQPAFGVKIDALSLQSNTLQAQGRTSLSSSMDVELPGGAEFTFKARKPGRAEVVFEALFPERMIDQESRKGMSQEELRSSLYTEVRKSVEVVECPLELNLMNQYLSQQPAFTQQFIGLVKNARLEKSQQEDDLYVYEGLETVVLTQKQPDCAVAWKKSERLVKIEARRMDKHYLVQIKRGPMDMQVTYQCPGGEYTANFALPDAGVQEWKIPLRGGTLDRSLHMPMASFWWVVQAKVRK
jgi:hypothetical protein